MPEEGWVPVANSAARDRSISWRARGLLVELLSYPDGWETSVDKLVALGQLAEGGCEGRDAMRSAMNELVAAGYVLRTKYRDGGKWMTTLDVSDQRRTVPENPASVDQSSENQASGNQASETQASLVRRSTNTDTKKDLHTAAEDSASLVSLAAAAAKSAAAADEIRSRKLDMAYVTIDKLTDKDRRDHLLVVEKTRSKIYRQARQSAIRQLDRDGVPESERSVTGTDALSYKYVAQHYINTSPTQSIPEWLARHLYRGN